MAFLTSQLRHPGSGRASASVSMDLYTDIDMNIDRTSNRTGGPPVSFGRTQFDCGATNP
jgi:hypothetical protein